MLFVAIETKIPVVSELSVAQNALIFSITSLDVFHGQGAARTGDCVFSVSGYISYNQNRKAQ